MIRLKSIIAIAMVMTMTLVSCDKNDEEVMPATSQNNNSGGNNGGGNGSGSTTVPKNSLVKDSTIALTEYTVGRLNTGNGNLGYQLNFWNQLTPRTNGYWVVGLHHIPSVDTTYESSFSYNWQNIPDGKFYFSRLQDGNGDSWWYTKSETILMDVKVEGDNITLTCSNVSVGNDFLPFNVTDTTIVSASIQQK